MHPRLLNGHTRATIIESFDGKVFIISGGFKKRCANLTEAQDFIAQNSWQVNVEMIHGSIHLQTVMERLGEKS